MLKWRHTAKLGKADCKGRLRNFVFKEVLFVQEENDGRFDEPFIVAYRVEQFHSLDHPIHFFILG